MVSLDRDQNFHLLGQGQLWHPNVAFAYPALATNICTFDIGLSLEYGGGGSYESHAVGFWGDGVLYSTANSNLGTTRFGDYVTIRQQGIEHPNLFDAFGYGLRSSSIGPYADVRVVSFGRPRAPASNRPSPAPPKRARIGA
jgi:hypothetical protein